MADENAAGSPKVSTAQESYELFKDFLSKWSGLAMQPVEKGDDEIPNLSLELGLMFFEPRTGILVVRSTEAFETLLEKSASTGKPRETRMGFFVEIVVLFWNRFVSKFWGLDSRKLPQAIFKKSIPLDWPNRKPDAVVTVFVEKELLEIRLWTPLLEGEMENWKKSRK
jgi:hypothetical protein